MFEQLVRPFAARPVTTTRRIVPIVKADDQPEEATVFWGAVGKLPQEFVQPRSTNLENIESVGFNLRGNLDNWKQSSREGENIEIPIRDMDDNQIGRVTVNRVKKLTFNQPGPGQETDDSTNIYLPNFGGAAFTEPVASKQPAEPPSGLRANVPSDGRMIMIQQFDYELDPGSNFGGDSAPNV